MPDSWTSLAEISALLLAALGAVVLLAVRGVRRPPPPVTVRTITPELQERARALLGQNKPIHAIKEVREATGMGLVEAKAAVDAMRTGSLPTTDSYEVGGPSLADRTRSLRDTSDVADAIALVCAETGMSQPEAERFVHALD